MAEGRYQKAPRMHTSYLADSVRKADRQPGGDNCIRVEKSTCLQKLYLAIPNGIDEVGGAVLCLEEENQNVK